MDIFSLNHDAYNLSDEEIISLANANKFANKNYHVYTINELHNVFYINILKRLEFFIENNIDDYVEIHNNLIKNAESTIIKWSKFKVMDILDFAKRFELIHETLYYLFLAFNNYKDSVLLKDVITTEYLLSFFNLFKKELVAKKFVFEEKLKIQYKRRQEDKDESLIQKRRKSDTQVLKEDLNKQKTTNISSLFLHNTINKFNKDSDTDTKNEVYL